MAAGERSEVLLRKSFEPAVENGGLNGDGVADGEFVVAGGEGLLVLELVDTAFDRVTVVVGGRAER